MNWQQIIRDMRPPLTFQQIAEAVGLTKGGVHDLSTGRQKAVLWDAGDRLLKLHRRITRSKT